MGNYITIAIIMLIPYGFFACALMEIWDFTIITYIVLYKAIEYLIILPAFTFIYSHSYRDEKKYDICDTQSLYLFRYLSQY